MMFTLFQLKNCVPVSHAEHEALCRVLDDYAKTSAGTWLNNVPYRGFTFKYCPAMKNSDVMGCWEPLFLNTVFLQPSDTPGPDPVAWIETIAPTAIHELRHSWQYRKKPLAYIVCCLPGLREITLERDAWKITKTTETIVENTLAWRQARRFEALRTEA